MPLDASNPSPVDANNFNGRVCLALDPRQLYSCATSGAGGLTVRLGPSVATTTADGSFVIAGQSGAGLVWSVTGSTIVTSYMLLSDYQIPAILKTTFDTMQTTNGVVPVAGEGSLMISVIRNGVGEAGATVTTTPLSTYNGFYDGSAPTVWQQTSTGANGTAWMVGLNVVGTTTATITAGGDMTIAAQPIHDRAITFAAIVFQ